MQWRQNDKRKFEEIYRNMEQDIPETIIYSDTKEVWCMGEEMDHPKVYYTIPDGGEAICGYCDIKFRLKSESLGWRNR